MVVDSAAAIRTLALGHAGVATLPEILVRAEVARGRLVEVLPEWRPVVVGVHAVWPRSSQRSLLTAGFVDFFRPRMERLFDVRDRRP
jgi:DNA-binding transcriptional LysR family regulator